MISSIKKALKLYVFRDIASDFEDGKIQSSVDILSKLDEIAVKQYPNDRSFHEDLYDAFQALNDMHTRYSSSCHHIMNYYQPWILSYRYNPWDGTYTVVVQDVLFKKGLKQADRFRDVMPSDPESFIRWKVLLIDGTDAFESVVAFALAEIGTVKDPNVRVNLAFGRFDYTDGNWRSFFGTFSSRTRAPKRGFVNYVLQSPSGRIVPLTIPFVTKGPTIFRDSKTYWLAHCLPYSFETHENFTKAQLSPLIHPEMPIDSDGLLNLAVEGHEMQYVPMYPGVHYDPEPRAISEKEAAQFLEFSINEPLYNGSTSAFYDIGDGVGVFKLSAFNDNSFPRGERAIQEWNVGFQLFKALGISKLILDFQNNGGGIICLSHALTNFLFPNTSMHTTDFITSDLFDTLAKTADEKNKTKSLFHFSWTDPISGQEFKSSSWMTEGPKYTRGGKTYTNLVNQGCKKWADRLKPTIDWKPENIVILTNGYCGSTCALATRTLSELHGVRSVTVGGIVDEPMSFSVFPGGQVFSYSSIIGETLRLNLSAEFVPKALPLNAMVSIAIREAYSWRDPHKPLEFTWEQSTERIPVTDANVFNPGALWIQTKQLMFSSG